MSNFTKNRLEVIFVTKMPNKFLSIKNLLFSQIIESKRFKSVETGRKTSNTAKQQKKLNVCQKLIKNTQNRLEMIYMTKDQEDVFLNSLFTKFVSKRFKSFKTRSQTTKTVKHFNSGEICLEITNTAKQDKNLKAVKNVKTDKTEHYSKMSFGMEKERKVFCYDNFN